MHKNCCLKRGFTLVEMLVVIAIISIVATASLSAVRGAQRQARTAKCQANMNALYKAVMAFRTDHSCFPPAAGYEGFDSRSGQFFKFRGWVNWVRTGSVRSRRNDAGNLYSKLSGVAEYVDGSVQSKASSYCYVGTGAMKDDYSGATGSAPNYKGVKDSRVYRSIDEGAIFVYADKNFSIYCCEEFKNRYGKQCMRSYTMNQIFGGRRYRRNPLCWDVPGFANRLALFVELGNASSKAKNKTDDLKGKSFVGNTVGKGAKDTDPTDTFGDDSVWDWDYSKGSGGDASSGENIGTMHWKSGKCYGHVMFADGHLESLELPKSTADQKKQRHELGSGAYGD